MSEHRGDGAAMRGVHVRSCHPKRRTRSGCPANQPGIPCALDSRNKWPLPDFVPLPARIGDRDQFPDTPLALASHSSNSWLPFTGSSRSSSGDWRTGEARCARCDASCNRTFTLCSSKGPNYLTFVVHSDYSIRLELVYCTRMVHNETFRLTLSSHGRAFFPRWSKSGPEHS